METKGPPALHAAKTATEKRNLMVRACRTGANNMPLMFSAVFDKIMRDCALDAARARDNVNGTTTSNEKKKSMIFRLFRCSDASAHAHHSTAIYLLNNLNIHHITERQGTPEWFKSRSFR